jgi:hypothetical protein
MAKKINQFPPLIEEQRKALLLLMKFFSSGDLLYAEWQFLKNATAMSRDLSLEEFIARMKAEVPAYLYRLQHGSQPGITEEELGLWCLTNDLPID